MDPFAHAIVEQYLLERMTYDQLFRLSEPKRVVRADTVRGPALEVKQFQDGAMYIFNAKSFPSTTGLRHKCYVHFFKPRRPKSLQNLECELDCECLTPESLVLMGDGTYRQIDQIQVGDLVYTHRGRRRCVTRVMARPLRPDERVFQLKVTGFPRPLTVTENHPIYALRGNEECLCGCGTDLAVNQLVSPIRLLERQFSAGHHRRLTTLEDRAGAMDWVRVQDLRAKEWMFHPWLEGGDQLVDADFARLVGYYVAEGCLPGGNQVRLTFNNNEFDTLRVDVESICRKLGYQTRLFTGHKRDGFDIYVKNGDFVKFCREHVGEGSHTKHLSATIMAWDNSALRELYIGAQLGDGHVCATNKIRYRSTSFDLVCQLSTILHRLGKRNLICPQGEKVNFPGEFHHQVWVPPSDDANAVFEWLTPYLHQKDRIVERREDNRPEFHRADGHLKTMTDRTEVPYDGLVYDLTVEEDESFIAHGFVVHNCPDFKYRWAWATKQRGSSKVGAVSLNQALNRAPRITNPGNRPGLCKHLLAMRKYIYGQVEQFSSREPYDSRRLDQLTARAQQRWIDYNGAILQGSIRTQMNRNLAATRQAQSSLKPGFLTGVTSPDASAEISDSQVVRVVNPSTLKLFEEVEAEIKRDVSPDQEVLELLRSIAASLKRMSGDDEPPELPAQDDTQRQLDDLDTSAEQQPAAAPAR